MSYSIDLNHLAQICPHTDQATLSKYISGLNVTLYKYNINTKLRVACFLGQVGVESGAFTEVEENLHYSAAGLLRVFPSHFTAAEADSYAGLPQAIANRVYANRMGNGPESSGDGWNYRGRGLIELTGKDAYLAFATTVGKSLEEVVDYLETPEGACVSAGHYWDINHLNTMADQDMVTKITIAVNGGTTALQQRIDLTNAALRVLA
jgi:putative chitinase